MLKISHIITGLAIGGAERSLYNLLTEGLQGPFVNKVTSLTDYGYYGQLLREAGIPVLCLGARRGLPSPVQLQHLRRALHESTPDVIQGWMYHGNIAALFAKCLADSRVKVCWNIRLSLEGFPYQKKMTQGLIRYGARLSRLPDAIIYNSHRSREQHRGLGYCPFRDHVIPNGFDLQKWQASAEARAKGRHLLEVSDDQLVIGYVARGHPQKDIPNLIAGFARMRRQCPMALLVCIGQDIQNFVSSGADLSGIRFLGQRSDVLRLMPGFDIFCLSSRAEGFPNVIGEAMACGVPCVSTDVGDAAEVIGDTGWVVPPGDPVALANALAAAYSMEKSQRQNFGRAARGRIAANFSMNTVVSRYAALYREVAQGGSRVNADISAIRH